MTYQTSNAAARFFDTYAPQFDAIYGNRNGPVASVINLLFRHSMVERYRKTLTRCKPIVGRTVLDVGCGPGHYCVALAKAGAAQVVGLDFAPNMVQIAAARARTAGVESRCSFVVGDFLSYATSARFDYVLLMGLMDYVHDPGAVIRRATEVARRRVFLSFPAAGGFLAWQRRLRYRSRCELFLYRVEQIETLMYQTGCRCSIERLGRDFFVTVDQRASSSKLATASAQATLVGA